MIEPGVIKRTFVGMAMPLALPGLPELPRPNEGLEIYIPGKYKQSGRTTGDHVCREITAIPAD